MSGACFSPEAPPGAYGTKTGARKLGLSPFSIRVLKGPAAAASIIPQWEDLTAHALEPNPFYEHWMLLPALESFAKNDDVRIVAVWREDQLAALLPLQRVRRYKGLPVSALASWRHRHCLLCTPLVRAEGAAECLAALFGWLRAEREGAPLLELSYIPAEGPFRNALKQAGLSAYASGNYDRALLLKERDAETYITGSLSRHLRQELRRRERRLAERGAVTHVVMQAGDDVGRWIDEFLRLEAAGWKGREGSALACSEVNRRFATEVFTSAFERGQLHMVGVDLDGRPLARCCSFLAGAGSYAFKTAYDEDFARYSPGVIAEVDRIRQFHGLEGAQWMDSFTAPDNEVLNALWKGRRSFARLLVGTGVSGKLLVWALGRLGAAKALLGRRSAK